MFIYQALHIFLSIAEEGFIHFSLPDIDADPLQNFTYCPQVVTVPRSDAAVNGTTCEDFAADNSLPAAGIRQLNPEAWCPDVRGADLCAPLSCKIQVVQTSTPARELAVSGSLKDPSGVVVSELQFWAWNLFINKADVVFAGDAVCVS